MVLWSILKNSISQNWSYGPLKTDVVYFGKTY